MPDRERVIKGLEEMANDQWLTRHADYYSKIAEDALELLKKPEAKTGTWIDDGFFHSNLLGQMTNWKCSNCHASVMNKGIKPDFEYCPHCGAKMEGAEHEEVKSEE